MNRYAMVECPKCYGECGESQIAYNGLGYTEDEEWVPCDACDHQGRMTRVARLAWLIGEARRSEPRPAPLTMPLVVRTDVTA